MLSVRQLLIGTYFGPFIWVLASISSTLAAEESPILQVDTGGHQAVIKSVLFSGSGVELVSAGDDKIIRIWNRHSRRVVRSIRGESSAGHSGKVFAMALSPDDRWLAVGGWMDADQAVEPCCGDIRLFDFPTGRLVQVLKGHENSVLDLSFSKDGGVLVSAGADKVARIWDMSTLSLAREIKHSEIVSRARCVEDCSSIITGSYDGKVRQWRIGDGRLLQEIAHGSHKVNSLAVSPTGEIAAGYASGDIWVWNVHRPREGRAVYRMRGAVGTLTFSVEGTRLLASCGGDCAEDSAAYVLDPTTGTPLVIYRGHDNVVQGSDISRNGQLAATAGGTTHAIDVWDLTTGSRQQRLVGNGLTIWNVGISPDGTKVAWGNVDPCPERTACPNAPGTLHWTLGLATSNSLLVTPTRLQSSDHYLRSVQQTGDWKLESSRGRNSGLEDSALKISRGKRVAAVLERDSTNGYVHYAYGFVRDTVISGGDHGVLASFDRGSGRLLHDFIGHEGRVLSLVGSPDGGLLISGGVDQTVRIWNSVTAELIVSLLTTSDDEWVMWTPQGYFTSSLEGDRLVGWQVNQGSSREARYVTARQLRKRLFSPEIVQRALILRSAKRAALELRGTDTELQQLLKRRPPNFSIIAPKDGTTVTGSTAKIVLELEGRQEDIDRVEGIVNERNVTPWRERGFIPVSLNRTTLEVTFPLTSKENRVRITAYDKFGYSTDQTLVINVADADVANRNGTFRVIAIGAGRYPGLPKICQGPNGSCDLKFPRADAMMLRDVLMEKAAPLHPANPAEEMVLVDESSLEPTADNIKGRLTEILRRATDADTTVVFLSGHGINLDEHYFFLPRDAEKLADGNWNRNSLVRWDVFHEAMHRTRGHRILLIDTCHAGAAYNPGLGNGYNARLEKDAGDSKIVVFSATRANSVAVELDSLQHGVFTYALVQGLSGKAISRDGVVRVLELGAHVAGEVERLTNGSQIPLFNLSKVENFAVSRP